MKRKYDMRNKRNFAIILGLVIILIIIFSLFIYKYKHTSIIEYDVDVSSVLQDVSKNYIDISEPAKLKVRWNDSYYLKYQDKKINLGKNVIVYNMITGVLKLYGKLYEINETGKVVDYSDETVLKNTVDAKFYKIADREYLLVDREIVSTDRSIDANNYLLVELDKMGNAKLSNNKLNLKTITPTTLVTSKYTFDIANEILKFGDEEIDLKKIIGTTNEYKEEEKPDEGEDENQDDNANNQNINQVVPQQQGAAVVTEIEKDPLDGLSLEDIRNKVKISSVGDYRAGLTTIDVDYIIYDPYNEYKSVYVEVVKAGGIDTIKMAKTDTHLVIDSLQPDTSYKLNFIYTTTNYETGEVSQNKFDELTVRTAKPVYTGKVTGIYPFLQHKLTYAINLQEGYSINKVNATVVYYCEETVEDNTTVKQVRVPVSINVGANDKTVNGQIDISDCKIHVTNEEKVIINSVVGNNGTVEFN